MNLETIPMKDANDLMKMAMTLKSMVERDNKIKNKLKDMLEKTINAMKKMGDEKDLMEKQNEELKKENAELKKENAELKKWCNYDDLEVD